MHGFFPAFTSYPSQLGVCIFNRWY